MQNAVASVGQSWLCNVDHVTYACQKGQAIKWAWYHIEVEGGTLISRIDDVRPGDPDSSMLIWCIDHGTFGSVLIEGIDRERESQVSAFARKHGDHSVQHVAFNTTGLVEFRERIESFGGKLRGDMLVRNDGFGMLRQVFGRGYEPGKADECAFPEYVERPRVGETLDVAPVTFSKGAGKGFYKQIEEAVDAMDNEELVNLDRTVPAGWTLPEVQAPTANIAVNTKDAPPVELRTTASSYLPLKALVASSAAAFLAGAIMAASVARVRG